MIRFKEKYAYRVRFNYRQRPRGDIYPFEARVVIDAADVNKALEKAMKVLEIKLSGPFTNITPKSVELLEGVYY